MRYTTAGQGYSAPVERPDNEFEVDTDASGDGFQEADRGEIRIRVVACGICHTELDEIEEQDLRPQSHPPG